jgi:hypothetical protein
MVCSVAEELSMLIRNQIFKIEFLIEIDFIMTKMAVYSLRKLFTGLASAALIDWKLTVIKAIKIAPRPARANIHQRRIALIMTLFFPQESDDDWAGQF